METQVQSLDWEDPLEKGMATHSSILTWRIPWTEEPRKLQSTESQRVRHDWAIDTFTLIKIQTEVTDFIFLGSKIIADSDHSHEIKRHWLFERKSMTNLDNILKSRDITLPTKVRIVKAMFFPVVMYGCETQIIKKAECWRTDAFKLWCWRRLFRAPGPARRLNKSILKKINPEYSLEGPMLKLQYFGHLMWRANSLEKTLMLGKIEGRRRRGQQRMRWLDGITNSVDMNLSNHQEIVEDRGPVMQTHGIAKNWTWLSDWTTATNYFKHLEWRWAQGTG